MHHPLTLSSIVAACVITGCALAPAEKSSPALEGTNWQLVSVAGPQLDIPAEPPIELRFMDSRVNFHGCNALSGRYTQEGRHIVVAKGFVGTRMKCNDELMAIDAAATKLLEQGVDIRVDDNGLVLQAQGQTWRFKRNGVHI